MESVKQIVAIDGMGCDHCVKAVRKALESVDGLTVESVEIGKAVVVADSTVKDTDKVAAAVAEAGYTVREQA